MHKENDLDAIKIIMETNLKVFEYINDTIDSIASDMKIRDDKEIDIFRKLFKIVDITKISIETQKLAIADLND